MSTTVAAPPPPALWSTLPGWGIAADLTPPELINARQLRTLRRLLAVGIACLLAICAAGFVLASSEKSSALTALATQQDRTSLLQAERARYSAVASMQGSIGQVRAQIAEVMGADVDLAVLMNELSSSLPSTMTIDQESITISAAGVADATASGLDTTGLPRIGTITLSGTGQSIDDLSDYVDALSAITGLVDIVPVSNSASDASTQFSITIGLTGASLSHRFDAGG